MKICCNRLKGSHVITETLPQPRPPLLPPPLLLLLPLLPLTTTNHHYHHYYYHHYYCNYEYIYFYLFHLLVNGLSNEVPQACLISLWKSDFVPINSIALAGITGYSCLGYFYHHFVASQAKFPEFAQLK